MKLTSFIRDKTSGYGVVTEDGIIDLSSSIEGASDIKSLLETNSMARAADYASGRSADFPVDEITFLPLIPNATKVICVAVNYLAHAREAGRTIGDYPVLFHRHAQTQVGHQQPLRVPKASEQLDFEGEIAVVIGKAEPTFNRKTPWTMLQAMPATTKAASGTGSSTSISTAWVRTSMRPAVLVPGWSQRTTYRIPMH